MSKNEAMRFLQEMKSDQELAEKVRAAIMGEDADPEANFSSVAAGLGFDFSKDELHEAAKELHETELEQAEGMEMSEEELDEVAGGVYHSCECKSTYTDGENCFNDDECKRSYHYYIKVPGVCKYTYDPTENCIFLERSL